MVNQCLHIHAFWQELTETLDQLILEFEQSQTHLLIESYRKKLNRIDSNLTLRFERDDAGGPVEMVLGCDGYPESISAVCSLISMAPKLEGVELKAFNERLDPVPARVIIDEVLCSIHDYWCGLAVVADQLYLSVYYNSLQPPVEIDVRSEAIMFFLDALIGEYDLMTRVCSIDWYELPIDPMDYGLFPLAELRTKFDQNKQRIKPLGITVH